MKLLRQTKDTFLGTPGGGFDPAYFPKLAALEDRHFWFKSRNKLIVWAIRKYFSPGINFLEIGCGTGFVLRGIGEKLPGASLAGSEYYEEALDFARRRVARAKLFQMDARSIPFRDEFDVIGAFDVLEHIFEDEVVLTQMFQAVRPKGGILLTVPQHPFLWSRFDSFSHHLRRYTPRELKLKVERAGFQVEDIRSFMSLLFPVLLLARYKRYGGNKAYDGFSELRTGAVLNTLAEKILSLERVLIASGVVFPFGGSLLLVARKA